MQYQVFAVSDRIYTNTNVGDYFQGGIVADGLVDHETEQCLLVVRYQQNKESYEIRMFE